MIGKEVGRLAGVRSGHSKRGSASLRIHGYAAKLPAGFWGTKAAPAQTILLQLQMTTVIQTEPSSRCNLVGLGYVLLNLYGLVSLSSKAPTENLDIALIMKSLVLQIYRPQRQL